MSTYMRQDPSQRESTVEPSEAPTAELVIAPKKCPIVSTGRYLARCVHPCASVANIIHFAQELEFGEERQLNALGDHMIGQYNTIVDFYPLLKALLPRDSDRVEGRLRSGMRSARASDAHKLKAITGALLTRPELPIALLHNTRADRGFNNDDTGRMLIPAHYFEEYNVDPVRVRALLNAGDPAYSVTAENTPAFLYEDPTKYNPDNVLAGLMRGYFLIRCFRALFISPVAGVDPLTVPTSTRVGLVKKYELSQVTVSHIVYTAIQARFALGSQETWTGTDAMFNYDAFTGILFEVFKLDTTWTKETIAWWNTQVFGNSNGLASGSPGASKSGLLAMAKAQLSRRADEEAAERAAAERAAVDRAAAESAAAERAAAARAAAERAAAERATAERAAAERAAAERATAERAAAERAAAERAAIEDEEQDEPDEQLNAATLPNGLVTAISHRSARRDDEDGDDEGGLPVRQSRKRAADGAGNHSDPRPAKKRGGRRRQ
ncbi:hypothetical protein V8E53_001807 [Lactarius tabidus]